jgi:hypothetical protein
LYNARDEIVALTFTERDAIRIVAAMNALVGVSTEVLNLLKLGDIAKALDAFRALRAQ